MKDPSILFSRPMIIALLDGHKTVTRRLLKAQHHWGKIPPNATWRLSSGCKKTKADPPWMEATTPTSYGATEIHANTRVLARIGQRVWVRETARAEEMPDGSDVIRYRADDATRSIENSAEGAERWGKFFSYRGKRGAWVNSIHMPRWVSRITLTITDVRVERLNDIAEQDALAEGVVLHQNGSDYWVVGVEHPNKDFPYLARPTAREMYAALWDVINGSGEWLGNPWVVAYTFDVRLSNIDATETA